MITYKGIVEGKYIKIKDTYIFLPQGTEVEILVKEPLQSFRKGSPISILKAIKSTLPLNKESAKELRQAIKEGQILVDWTNPFDKKE